MDKLASELYDRIFMAVCQSIAIKFGTSYKDAVTVMKYAMEPLRKIAAYNVFRELRNLGDTRKASNVWASLSDAEKNMYHQIAQDRNNLNMRERIDVVSQIMIVPTRKASRPHHNDCQDCRESKRSMPKTQREGYNRYVEMYHPIITNLLTDSGVPFKSQHIISLLGHLYPSYASCRGPTGLDAHKFNPYLNDLVAACVENKKDLGMYIESLKH